MIARIFLVFLFIHEASLEVTVEGVVGGSVVLPCFESADQRTIQDINVNWRHNESRFVYDIIKGKASDEDQELEYKNRTESFPEVYLKGNFSLRLKNLQETDTGKYSCFINKESQEEEVNLIVKGRPEISEDKNNHKGDKLEDKENQGAQTRPEMIVMFLLPLSILVFM
ncbi:CD276 antigen homolog [Misgurnus anguillicaudatus]|uniref:CD276 antigen homolog n=1 Tax=Misgurnus anguillicaudatus TaxID=75329 RepID=UPI003CCF5E31